MNFLDLFSAEQRAIFDGVSTELHLDRGNYLMRRGEPGGDLFMVEKGQIEIIDSRSTPEAILAVLEAGSVVGEGSFLDDSPRSADARAPEPVRVRRWSKEDLRALLQREPALAVRFYESIARATTARLRDQNQTTLLSLAARESNLGPAAERTRAEVLEFSNATKEALLEAESLLRQESAQRAGRAAVVRTMSKLESWVDEHFRIHPEPEIAEESGRLLCRELHPYLVRSALAERTIRRTQGVAGVTEVLAHILVDTPSGDGQLGEILDRWLLDRPSFIAIRAARTHIPPAVRAAVPTHRNRRVTVLNAGTGSLVAALGAALAGTPTVMSVVDQSREALGFLDAGLTVRPSQVRLDTIQANLVEVALGRTRQQLPQQDVIVAHGLIEYLPDRLALGLLNEIRNRLHPEGTLVLATLGPARDRALLDRLLGWPTVRRRIERIKRLVERANMTPHVLPDLPDPLFVLTATRP